MGFGAIRIEASKLNISSVLIYKKKKGKKKKNGNVYPRIKSIVRCNLLVKISCPSISNLVTIHSLWVYFYFTLFLYSERSRFVVTDVLI